MRDFTYIDDILNGLIRILDIVAEPNLEWNSENPDSSSSRAPWKIYNIGSNNPIKLLDFVEKIEKALDKNAVKEFLPMQPGDIPDTHAEISNLLEIFKYKPSTTLEEGITSFVNWFREYYKL